MTTIERFRAILELTGPQYRSGMIQERLDLLDYVDDVFSEAPGQPDLDDADLVLARHRAALLARAKEFGV